MSDADYNAVLKRRRAARALIDKRDFERSSLSKDQSPLPALTAAVGDLLDQLQSGAPESAQAYQALSEAYQRFQDFGPDTSASSPSTETTSSFSPTEAEVAAAACGQALSLPTGQTKKGLRNWLLADLLASGATVQPGPDNASLDLRVGERVFRLQVSIPRAPSAHV